MSTPAGNETIEDAPVESGEPAAEAPVVAETTPIRREPVGTGATEVEREVVEKIAAAAARSVPGVSDLGGDIARFFDSVLDRIGLDEVGDATRGVRAEVNGIETTVSVVLVISADGVVPDITTAVRTTVTEALVRYGLKVIAVNIKVDDITMA
ncbi:Asp23/Gls24 family envelope stress response protein [Kineosporia succinea]|uniref:Alkaline shock family protein YloU n=1 Tax=Kineosporia succinea TaxID=84632 RepID=A0ABT9P4F5_9ACTN|nr:Asp23/Gls24 family envelope stress response protein [Kineosporia succinea]MDP9826940.1 putative alkaline shock family protein YloU [Kineosporia succinea]